MYILKMPVNGVEYYYQGCSYMGVDYVYMTRDINQAKLLESPTDIDFTAYDTFTSDDGLVNINETIHALEEKYSQEGNKDSETVSKVIQDMGWTFEHCTRATAIEPTSYVLMTVINSMTVYFRSMESVSIDSELVPSQDQIFFTPEIDKAMIFTDHGTHKVTFIDTHLEKCEPNFLENCRYRVIFGNTPAMIEGHVENRLREYFKDLKRVPVHRATLVIKKDSSDI